MFEERSELLLPTLQEVWGYPELRPGQREVIEAWCEGSEVLGLLPTGAGKSMCYQLPALVERRLGRGTTLVVSPLIALMQDQVDALVGLGVTAAALNSTLSRYEQEEVETALEAGLLDVLLVSPERAAQPRFKRLLQDSELALIAIDEAHCLSQWGHDFRPEYARLAELRQVSDAPVIALTATATARVVDEIVSSLELEDVRVIKGSFARPNLRFKVRHESSYDTRMAILMEELDELGLRDGSGEGRAIVYCSSRKKVEQVAADLRASNFRVGYYHAGRSQEDRLKAQSAFELSRTRVLVATNAFGMGVDYPDVRLIVHFQAPGSLEAYYQEAGRASRDGEPGHCLMFFSAGDMVLQRRLVRDNKDRLRANERLARLEAYAMALECRQNLLCQHFDEEHEAVHCEVCDVCVSADDVMMANEKVRAAHDARTTPLPSEDLDIIVSAVGNLRRPVGKSSLARALRGSRAKALRRYGLLNLPEHGRLKERDEASLVCAIEGLLKEGRLVPKGQKYPTVWLPGKPVRRGKAADDEESGSSGRSARPATRRSSSSKTATPKRKAYPKTSNLRRAIELYRNRTAKKLGWKPYMVLHKKAIIQLDEKRPKELEELYEIDGLGPAKVERFGWELLDIVRRYDQP